MKTAEEKAVIIMKEVLSDSSTVDSIENLIIGMLKEQDRDTRHACADACLDDDTHTNNMFFHRICMNVKAV